MWQMPSAEIFVLFKRCNKYIDETMPWALAKDEAKQDRLATVLYNLAESISIGATLLESFMPETADKILAQLNTRRDVPLMRWIPMACLSLVPR